MESLNSTKLIRLSKSCLGEAEKQAVMGVLDREYLGMGQEVQQFEEALTKYFGRPAVCVANGTSALHLALQACGVGSGDEVLVQSLTYVASFQAISATGAVPVACDVDPLTLTLDWRDAKTRLTSRTKAIMPMHYAGGVGALQEIYQFASVHGLRVIEDAAHAFGTIYRGQLVGSFGDISCFSFDGIKNITSGEGGCVVTNDLEVIKQIQDARLLGVEKDTQKRFSSQRSWEFDVIGQGWRYHMSNIMAAIGLEQLKKFDQLASQRKNLANLYDSLLRDHPRILLFSSLDSVPVPHIYAVGIRGLTDRDALRVQLLDCGIETGVHYQPNHKLSYYHSGENFYLPVTDSLAKELLTLPLHPHVTERDVNFVCENLLRIINF